MSEWSWRRVVWTGVGAVCAIWLLGPLIILLVGRFLLRSSDVAAYGAAGDMFGISSSLFAGLGLLGVAVVLYHDMRERRKDLIDRQEQRRPLLLPEIRASGVVLSRAVPGNFTDISLTVDLTISNATDEPALNIDLSAKSGPEERRLDAVADFVAAPIAGKDSTAAQVKFSASGPQAQEFLSTVAGEGRVRIDLTLSYDSLNGVRWQSTVAYEVRSRPVDRETIQKIRDGNTEVTVGTPDTPLAGGLPFTSSPVPNSWSQTRVRDENRP